MSQIQTPRDLLIALQRMEFDGAAALDFRQLKLHGVALLLALAGFFLPEQFAWFVALVLVLTVGWAFWLMHLSRERRSLAEKARRVTVLVDGLGFRLSPSELRNFEGLTGATDEELSQWTATDFFATHQAHGVKRAVEIAEENSFWSFHLYRASADWAKVVLIVVGVVLIACLLLSFSPWLSRTSPVPVEIFATTVSSLVLIEILARCIHYSRAAVEMDKIYQRLGHIRETGYSKDDLILALMDYNAVVESAPMMAPGAHARNCDRLNALWKQKYG